MAGHRARSSSKPRRVHDVRTDVENLGKPQKDRKYRFRDNGHLEPDDERRVEFKKTLLRSTNGPDANLERFRRSDEEVDQSFEFKQSW